MKEDSLTHRKPSKLVHRTSKQVATQQLTPPCLATDTTTCKLLQHSKYTSFTSK